jgi:hypothetical protein
LEKKLKMKKPIRIVFMLPVFILLAGLACKFSGGPTPPRVVPVSTEQAQNLSKTVQSAKPDPTSGNISITITEAQITSYVVQNLRENYEPILSNPVIVFQPNQVELYGTIQGDAVTANGRVVMSVVINEQGQPVVTIREANFGPIPVPSGLLSNLSVAVDRSISDAMKSYRADYKLQSVRFDTGTATIAIAKK